MACLGLSLVIAILSSLVIYSRNFLRCRVLNSRWVQHTTIKLMVKLKWLITVWNNISVVFTTNNLAVGLFFYLGPSFGTIDLSFFYQMTHFQALYGLWGIIWSAFTYYSFLSSWCVSCEWSWYLLDQPRCLITTTQNQFVECKSSHTAIGQYQASGHWVLRGWLGFSQVTTPSITIHLYKGFSKGHMPLLWTFSNHSTNWSNSI